MQAYVISLLKRQREWGIPAIRMLSTLGLSVTLVDGVLCEQSLAPNLSLGQSGCLLAHIKVAKLIKENGPAFVFEDDVVPRRDLNKDVFNFYTNMFSSYSCYLLGSSERGHEKTIKKDDFYFAGSESYGTFALYYTEMIADRLLKRFEAGQLEPVDHMFIKHGYLRQKTPVIYPNLFVADEQRSDIISGGHKDVETLEEKGLLYNWELRNYDFDYKENT